MLEPGTPLPRFTALNQDGVEVDTGDWKGKWTVLWWYAEAFTDG